jgi:hypothetical protein
MFLPLNKKIRDCDLNRKLKKDIIKKCILIFYGILVVLNSLRTNCSQAHKIAPETKLRQGSIIYVAFPTGQPDSRFAEVH